MTRTLCRVLAAALLINPAAAGFDYGPRPTTAVFDPARLLDPQQAEEISVPLERIFENENVDVIAVVLTDLKGVPAVQVAESIAAAWCDAPIHAVVLHVPDEPESPWIAPGGPIIDALDPEEVRESVAQARRNASRETDETGKLRAACTEAADLLRFWMGGAVQRREFLENERAKIRLELETKARQQQVLMLTVAAALVPLIIGVWLVFRLIGKSTNGKAG